MMSVDWSGWHSPLHATAAGKVLLAHMPEAQRQRVLRRPLERLTEYTVVDRSQLVEQLRAVHEEGYGYIVEELEVGMTAVAAPIYSAEGSVIASVAVSGPTFRLPTEEIPATAKLVKTAAEDISRQIGFYGDVGGEGSIAG